MAYWTIPAGSTFGLGRKWMRQMFTEIYEGDIWTYLTTSLKIGSTESGDYLEVEPDGTLVNRGDSTTWDDIVGSLISSRLYSVVGKLDYNFANNSITMQSGGSIGDVNDRLIFSFQYPHAAKVNGTMNLHIHWEQYDDLEREFTIEYRIQNNGSAKTEAWTQVIVTSPPNDLVPYVSGTINQITKLVDVDMTGASISATVQFRLARTDTSLGDIEATFIDAHVERDMNGSREEYVK